ncbi:MAG: aminoacyl-tRNA hydrolase [Oscillatoriales cyanobacterium]|uniref:Peptidyl-tRNA hydrolase n=1 Tax=Microcoleus anatoxicus PTRS2 TaxID=2705321 RepID=A0ABU8YKU1_9CYAN|nr:MAG: aminoacyl-tRNA hydrolase [Oscillatoriales cyanobacterium]TAD96179.1 MAG: aminoacyl-tRNA hydrolase [Oscillatoriales cyanobacterium]TAE03872.1 MAG: aminoacyl-tRNA hydrolase [Oscillatoriales cyanobacterium]TAF06920.1 MAG: aminoacyl-tRNA hydrolase [Oscillatoriales cyanobacterium]TAF47203.1 MAG: aminoacyl-tRNA hydrolase [Oscillatoriales cyanobacterium]
MNKTQKSETPAELVIPQLIVGLGNPEPKYDRTRHNIGFNAVDALAQSWQISLSENRKFQGIFGEGNRPRGQKIRLLKPLTYMNLSGQSIRAVADWYKIPAESVLVVYDDMDLPIGKIRMRLSGSAGGHNGMKSAIAHLGTDKFPRLRIGIGKPQNEVSQKEKDTISFVLGKFSSEETQLLENVLKLVREAVELSLHQGVEKSMSLYNSRTIAAINAETKR